MPPASLDEIDVHDENPVSKEGDPTMCAAFGVTESTILTIRVKEVTAEYKLVKHSIS